MTTAYLKALKLPEVFWKFSGSRGSRCVSDYTALLPHVVLEYHLNLPPVLQVRGVILIITEGTVIVCHNKQQQQF